MCRNSRITITLAPHLCMPRISQPNVCSSVMNRIDEYAPLGDGS